jgi:hypothetical protein
MIRQHGPESGGAHGASLGWTGRTVQYETVGDTHMANTRKIGRDAETGKFIPVEEAERRKRTAVVETIKLNTPKR